MTKTIGVGQIGVGYWGPNLMRNVVQNGRATLRAVADLSGSRRDYTSERYPQVAVTASHTSVLADPTIDAVIIATPAATHFDLTMQALHSGKHVLVEKPMATTVDEVTAIEEAAKKRGLVAMVGHTFLYNDSVLYLKQIVDSGELGTIRYVLTQRLNLGRIRSDVDAMWNFAPHDVSILQYLLDYQRPDRVSRFGASFVQPDIDDVVFMNLSYPSGVMAHLHMSWLDPIKVRRLTVVGSKKMVVYDDMAEYRIAIYDKGIDPAARLGERMDYDEPTHRFEMRSGDAILPSVSTREPLRNEIDHWIDAISLGEPCRTGPEHARSVVEILERATKESEK